jgi:hypothetical protein
MAPVLEEDDFLSDTGLAHNGAEQNLSDALISTFSYSRFDAGSPRAFLPAGCIEKLITQEAVIKELLEKVSLSLEDSILREGTPKKKLVDFIISKAKKVFAIAVLSNFRGPPLVSTMKHFMKLGFSDSSETLPIDAAKLTQLVGDITPPWNETGIFKFCEAQWKFFAPVFSGKEFPLRLEIEHILPFTERNDQAFQGAFGQVYAVKIHPQHQENPVKKVSFCCLIVNWLQDKISNLSRANRRMVV